MTIYQGKENSASKNLKSGEETSCAFEEFIVSPKQIKNGGATDTAHKTLHIKSELKVVWPGCQKYSSCTEVWCLATSEYLALIFGNLLSENQSVQNCLAWVSKVYKQGYINRGTCSHPELTSGHVLTSAYVIIFRAVTRNAVNKSV